MPRWFMGWLSEQDELSLTLLFVAFILVVGLTICTVVIVAAVT